MTKIQMVNIIEGVEKLEPLVSVAWNIKLCNHFGNIPEDPQMIKHKINK